MGYRIVNLGWFLALAAPVFAQTTTIRPDGFVDWISELRSGSTNDTVNTRFGSIPLTSTPDQWLTSVAHSRVMLHTNTDFGRVQFNTYLEADFLQTANRAPFRWRQYWGEVKLGRWRLMGGQGWSLLRPDRTGTASDVDLMNTQVVDPAYHIGLAGARRRQVRLTREFDHGNTAQVEWESNGKFLSRFSHDTPDRRLHLEGTAYVATRGRHGLGAGHSYALRPNLRIVGSAFVSRGGGPEMLGILPANIRAVSVLEGLELAFRHGRSLYTYGGLVHGSHSSGNHLAREYTIGGAQRVFDSPSGTLTWNTQVSQFDRSIWDGRSGLLTYVMTGIRYSPPLNRR